MLKRLFDSFDHHLPEGIELSSKAGLLVKPLIDQYYEAGYSLRDIQVLLGDGINESILLKLMDTAQEREKNYAIKIGFTNQSLEIALNHDQLSELQKMNPSHKVLAIKQLRVWFACGLKEAKDVVETLSFEGYANLGVGYATGDSGNTGKIVDVMRAAKVK